MLKSGDKTISTVIRRTSKGLEINVRLHEGTEEFMKAASGETTTAVGLYSRKWQSTAMLHAYDIPDSMNGVSMVNGTTGYRLDRPGSDIYTIEPNGLRVVNMSFVRLVGASGPDGVTFSLTGAFEREETLWLGQAIIEAGNLICKKYIYPMIISINNIIKEPGEGAGYGV